MLRYGFETPYGGYFEQERNIALGEGRHGARRTLAFVRLFGSEHTQVDTIAGGKYRKVALLALHGRPIEIGMISLKLGINEILVTFARNGVVVGFLP